MGIKREMGIKGKGDARAYKSKESKSFGYIINVIIITKVKNKKKKLMYLNYINTFKKL